MRIEAITLVACMAVATVLTAACDKPPLPEARQSSPAPSSPAATPSLPPPPVASASERKDGAPPIQGQADPTQPAQRRDFQTR